MKGPRLAEGRTAEVFEWTDGRVLKLIRPGFAPELADREARIVRELRRAGIPCPAAEDVVEVEGRRGVVFERTDGPSMFAAILEDLDAGDRWASTLADLHAEMHAAWAPPLPSLGARLERRVRGAPGMGARAKRSLLATLQALPDGAAVCHGDFHPGNVHLTPRGPVVIDWVDATRGNPLADVARTTVLIEVGRPPMDREAMRRLDVLRPTFLRLYLDRYASVRHAALEMLEAWRPIVAAARLDERIPGERRRLKRIIREGL